MYWPVVDDLPSSVTLPQTITGGVAILATTGGDPGSTPSKKLPIDEFPPAEPRARGRERLQDRGRGAAVTR